MNDLSDFLTKNLGGLNKELYSVPDAVTPNAVYFVTSLT